MQIETIEFRNVDDFIEMIETRFNNANVEMIESIRVDIIDDYNLHKNERNRLIVHFDVLHDAIERALRNTIAMHYFMRYATNNHDATIALINDENSHNFEIVDARTNIVYVRFSIKKTSIQIHAI